ncbi:MAG: hypothetical protein AB8B93_09415 [Pseudomonadales bacterium]
MDHRNPLASNRKEFEAYQMWMIGANTKSVVSGILDRGVSPNRTPQHFYNLKGLEHKRFLQYERQGSGRGINIGWTKNASAETASKKSHWGFFPKQEDASRANLNVNGVRRGGVVYGEIVAIGWWPPKEPRTYTEFSAPLGANVPRFLTSKARNVGANLEWSKNGASYEWVILGGTPGTRVRGGEDKVVLFNLKSKQPLLYANRTIGAKVGFHDFKTITNKIVTKRPEIDLSTWRALMLKPAQDASR